MVRLKKICKQCGASIVVVGLTVEMLSAHPVECPNGCARQPAHPDATHVENDKHPFLVKEPPSAAVTSMVAYNMGVMAPIFEANAAALVHAFLNYPKFEPSDSPIIVSLARSRDSDK
jgi:hypothetical protein